jgi:hypothetical protein
MEDYTITNIEELTDRILPYYLEDGIFNVMDYVADGCEIEFVASYASNEDLETAIQCLREKFFEADYHEVGYLREDIAWLKWELQRRLALKG